MSAEQFLTKFDFDKFTWKQSTADSPGCWERPLAGSELVQDVWNRFEKGNQTLFLAVYLDFASLQSEAAVREAARGSWISLRHQIPIVATTIEIDENDVPLLKYRVPNDHQLGDWATRTLLVHPEASLDLNKFREKLGDQKIPSPAGDQTWMHLVFPSSATVGQIGLIFHTHHSVTDGNGAKIIVNTFLAEFGKQLGRTADVGLAWGEEVEKLTPAIFNILGPAEPVPIPPSSNEQPTFAHPLYGTLGAEMQNIGESMQNQYGFKTREADKGWPKAGRVELVFSKDESKELLAYMKDQPYTLTVLAHAALAMVVMFSNPASPETAKHTMNNFCMVDVRPRLKEPFSSRHGYAGYALAPPMLCLPVSLFLSSEGAPLPLDRAVLLGAMDHIRARYKDHKDMAIAYIAQAAEMFVYGMKQGYAANHVSANQCYMLSNDGQGENILDLTFRDEKGQATFNLSRFFTSINHPHPAPYFRLSSWQGVIDIGADFNENLISAEEVKDYLAKWKEFMYCIMK
ncbi:hypothetical protein DFH08DRAFT_971018 [Mycena albidolilacea]|uniref:Uncharacterized protein n=1 Tax=Mycena albidolilacea TaxID=1033008 RepID=A0AAD7EF90_9AGAR|nr:hypothetical protein DFH08DRAFT_971018 [Mycena albidolilacea]